MQYAISCQGDSCGSVNLIPRNRVASFLSQLAGNQHATIRPIPDEDVLCVWSISPGGCVRLVGQFADEDESHAIELATATECDGFRSVILPKTLGRPSFIHRTKVAK